MTRIIPPKTGREYTLCEYQGKARRNGSRNGFAFYIAAISGKSTRSGYRPFSHEAGRGINAQSAAISNTLPFSLNLRQIIPVFEPRLKPYGLRLSGAFSLPKKLYRLSPRKQAKAGIVISPAINSPESLVTCGFQRGYSGKELFRLSPVLFSVCPVCLRRLP